MKDHHLCHLCHMIGRLFKVNGQIVMVIDCGAHRLHETVFLCKDGVMTWEEFEKNHHL